MARNDEKKETAFEMIGAVFVAMAAIIVLAWITSSHKIVYATMAPGMWFGAMWKMLPGEYGVQQWNWLVLWVERALANLNEVSVVDWVMFVCVAFQPLMALLCLLHVPVVIVLGRKRTSVQRRFTPDGLIRLASEKFTGNLPILKLRRAIAADRLTRWRLPVQPEEVLTKWRLPEQSARPEWAGRAICNLKKAAFDDEIARLYFMGLQPSEDGKRLSSEMLGRQVVDLVRDTEHAERIVFADRFSNEGKALLALWAPACFAGAAGRDEYEKLKDALNRSAYGTEDGMANLTLAQEQYDKYRDHPELRALFAVHHWEYTALFALMKRAQRFGVFTTAEVLWLRPMNRILFAALNSCGRHTPHLEGATTFAMHRFEGECARLKRLPLLPIGPGGELRHMIFVDKAVDALRAEFVHLVDAEDEEDDIWTDKSLWKRTNVAVTEWARQSHAQQTEAAARAAQHGIGDLNNPFDQQMRAREAEARNREQADLRADLMEPDF